MIWSAFLAAVCLLLLAASVFDVSFRAIPNWISGGLFLLALPVRIISHDLPWAAFTAAAVFLLVFICWKAHWIRGSPADARFPTPAPSPARRWLRS